MVPEAASDGFFSDALLLLYVVLCLSLRTKYKEKFSESIHSFIL